MDNFQEFKKIFSGKRLRIVATLDDFRAFIKEVIGTHAVEIGNRLIALEFGKGIKIYNLGEKELDGYFISVIVYSDNPKKPVESQIVFATE